MCGSSKHWMSQGFVIFGKVAKMRENAETEDPQLKLK